MSLLFGTFAHVWASIIAVPVAIVITALIFWVYRWSFIQRVVMPGANECRQLEGWLNDVMSGDSRELTDQQVAMISTLGQGMLHRNGLNAVAVAIVFLAVFTGSHALLAAL